MEKISIGEILSATKGKLLQGNTDETITSVCIDSRNIIKNCLFIPMIGEKEDGHNFISDAFKSGATAAFIQSDHKINSEFAGALIEVRSCKKSLQDLAKYYRKKFNITVIGVTGSVGKTTTKEMIASALGENLNVLKSPGNYNGQIGLPLAIFNLSRNHQAAIFEMGISQFGEMDILAEIADPTIAVITNIGLSHIENFKNIENTKNEKLKILKNSNGIFYLNGDSPLLSNVETNIKQKVVYFGINGAYTYKCEDIYANQGVTNFTLATPEFKENIQIPCLGIHNVYNALAAIAIALDMRVHLEDIKKGLSKFTNIEMRQQITHTGDITLVDDSYNASPDSVKGSVGILRNIKGSGKNIVVIADMLELGEQSENIHFETGRYIAIEGIDVLITIGEKAKFLLEGAKDVNKNIIAFHCGSNEEAFKKILEFTAAGDKILVKGSRSMHTEEVVKKIKEYFITRLSN